MSVSSSSLFQSPLDSSYIMGKYKDIYEKRNLISKIRFDLNLSDEEKIEKIKEELQNLSRLEHDLVLLQKEQYDNLDQELNLNLIKFVTSFPKYNQFKERSKDDFTLRINKDEEIIQQEIEHQQSTEQLTTTTLSSGSSSGSGSGTTTRQRSRSFLPTLGRHAHSGLSANEPQHPVINKAEAKKILEEIREIRVELLVLKRKKKPSEQDEERILELENQIKEKENLLFRK
ncbi:hypothetical protein ABK040_014703 [Willaertia magna]